MGKNGADVLAKVSGKTNDFQKAEALLNKAVDRDIEVAKQLSPLSFLFLILSEVLI